MNNIVKAEINPNVELAEILLYLADAQEKTVQYVENNPYCRAISAYFSPFRDHPAVRITRRLVYSENFIHRKPLRAVLTLEDILSDREHRLYEWAGAMREFVSDAAFDSFLKSQSAYYEWILQTVNRNHLDEWIHFIEAYFRQKPDVFKLIICPLAGNYGFVLPGPEGNTAYTVQCLPLYDEAGDPSWPFDFFAKGIAHEYGHCFVNPVVEANKEILSPYASFFHRHVHMPRFYNVDYAVINEYWVRAFAIRFMEFHQQEFPDFDIPAEYQRQKESFIYIERFVDFLKEFEKSDLPFREFYLKTIHKIGDLN